jgi:hypothetical protein
VPRHLLMQFVQTITDSPFPDICLLSDAMPASCVRMASAQVPKYVCIHRPITLKSLFFTNDSKQLDFKLYLHSL